MDTATEDRIDRALDLARDALHRPISKRDREHLKQFFYRPSFTNWMRVRGIVLNPNPAQPNHPLTFAQAIDLVAPAYLDYVGSVPRHEVAVEALLHVTH